MQSWYLLYCKRGQLQRAQEHLERQAVNCLTPMITLEKIVRGKRTTVSEPLFPNYMFVEFDPEVIHHYQCHAWCQPFRPFWSDACDRPFSRYSPAFYLQA